jgi:transposase InsO family protein
MSAPFVVREVQKHFYWGALRKDAKRVCNRCRHCAQLNSVRQAAHGLFSSQKAESPRALLAMDYTVVGESESGMKYILVLLDLFSGAIELAATKDQGAKTTCNAFLDKIVWRYGMPLVLFSDAAPQLIGAMMQELVKTLGNTKMMNTRTASASSNGGAERVMRYLNKCLRSLSDEAYRKWDEHLQAFCFAYNIATRPGIEMSPFEVGYGRTPRIPGLHQLTATENQRLTIEDLPDAAVPSAHFAVLQKNIAIAHQIAKNVRNYQREEVARNLNGRGRPRRFAVGQAITYYKACTQPVAGRRAKHSLEWYPGTVTKLLGTTGVEIRDTDTGRLFQRHNANVNPCQTPGRLIRAAPAPPIRVGGVVLYPACEEDMDKATLAEITKITETEVELALWATTGQSWETAVWKRAYVDEEGRLALKPLNYHRSLRGHELWVGTNSVEVIEKLPVRGLSLTGAGKLTAAALREVRDSGAHLHLF